MQSVSSGRGISTAPLPAAGAQLAHKEPVSWRCLCVHPASIRIPAVQSRWMGSMVCITATRPSLLASSCTSSATKPCRTSCPASLKLLQLHVIQTHSSAPRVWYAGHHFCSARQLSAQVKFFADCCEQVSQMRHMHGVVRHLRMTQHSAATGASGRNLWILSIGETRLYCLQRAPCWRTVPRAMAEPQAPNRPTRPADSGSAGDGPSRPSAPTTPGSGAGSGVGT